MFDPPPIGGLAMAFSMAFDTTGTAFDDGPREEVARILRDAADAIEYGPREREGTLRDHHGGIVGRWILVGIGEAP